MPAATGDRFDRPIFIVSMPRSGSTLLFETLAKAPGLFTIGGESHRFIEGLAPFTPAAHGWDSNRLTGEDAQSPASAMMVGALYDHLRDRNGQPRQGAVRMLEKTPKNALRVPFIEALWPDGIYVYLYRDPRPTLASMMRAWQSGKFKTYSMLPGWTGLPWSLLLIPGWRDLIGAPLPQIVAHQWSSATNILLDDLAQIPQERIRCIVYEDFLADPQGEMERLTASLDLGWDAQLRHTLPASRMTLTAPDPEKWRELEAEVTSVLERVEAADQRVRNFLRSFA